MRPDAGGFWLKPPANRAATATTFPHSECKRRSQPIRILRPSGGPCYLGGTLPERWLPLNLKRKQPQNWVALAAIRSSFRR